MTAYVVAEIHKIIFAAGDGFFYFCQVFAEFFTVALASESRKAHNMMISEIYAFHYFTNLLSLFVKTAATVILTASGIINGITHHPRIVVIAAGLSF